MNLIDIKYPNPTLLKEIKPEISWKAGRIYLSSRILLRLILMSVFDGELSSREIERKTRADIEYIYR